MGLDRAVAVRRRRDDPARLAPERRPRRAATRRMGTGAVPRRRPAVGERRVPDRVGQGRARQRPARSDRASRALPTYIPPRESPDGDQVLAARYPLQLLTPKHHTRFLNSSYSPLPKHGPLEGAPFVELDPADAATRGLADGDCARVWNDRASVEVAGPGQRPSAPGRDGDPVRLVDAASTPTARSPTVSPTTPSPNGAAAWRTATPSCRSSAPTPGNVRPRWPSGGCASRPCSWRSGS